MLNSRYLELRAAVLDMVDGVVLRGPEPQPLTPLELTLLRTLLASPGPVSRDELLLTVWGRSPKNRTRSVEAAIWRLRTKLEADPSQPDHLQTVRGAGYQLVGITDPTPALSTPASNLPPAQPLIGRGELRMLLQTRLQRRPLLTVVGPPGVGKSQLVIAALQDIELPVWRIDADLTPRRADWLQAVGHQLGMHGTVLPNALERRLAALGPGVLFLDNLDPLIEVCAATIARWRAAARALTIIVTAREPLALSGEVVFPVAPLETADAVALLRAQTGPSDANLTDLANALDRLPLALELAAGWLSVLTPDEMLHRLREGRATLSSTRRDAPVRHQSLDDALALSWDHLEEDTQIVLSHCAAFHGTFAFADLEAISTVATADLLRAVQLLRQRSLLHTAGARLQLLKVVARYVRERRPPPPEVQARHAQHFLQQGLAWVEASDRHGDPEVSAALRNALPDLEAAAAGEGAVAARCGVLVYASGLLQADRARAAEVLERALAICPPDEVEALARVTVVYAGFLIAQGDERTTDTLARGVLLAQQGGDPLSLTHAWRLASIHHRQSGRLETSLACLNEAQRAAVACGDPFWELVIQGDRLLTTPTPDLQELTTLRDTASAHGYSNLADMIALLLASKKLDRGDLPALPPLEEALIRCRQFGERRKLTMFLLAVGVTRHRQALPAREHLEEALALALEDNRPRLEAHARLHLVSLAGEDARQHFLIGRHLAEKLSDPQLLALVDQRKAAMTASLSELNET